MTLDESASLTPEQLRVAVAERLGWTISGFRGSDLTETWYVHPNGVGLFREITDYPNDLNACAEMEATLTHEQAVRYRLQLSRNSDGPKATFQTVEAAMCHAKPTQRCRAFLAVTSEVTENRNE